MAPIIVMTGFMGSGKTTVGRLLAARLGYSFTDLDAEIEKVAGEDIPTIFSRVGEGAFRVCERRVLCDVLRTLASDEGSVLAVGGGALLDEESIDLVRDVATVVYLEIDGEKAWQRVRSSERPLAVDKESFISLLESRRPMYETSADATVRVGEEDADRLAGSLVSMLEPKLRKAGP